MATQVDSVRFTSQFQWSVSDTTPPGGASGAHTSSGTQSATTAGVFTAGTAAGSLDKIYLFRGTLAASASVDVDLSGSLTDPLGNAVTFAEVRGVYFQQVATSGYASDSCTVGATVANAAAAWNLVVPRGGAVQAFSPTTNGLFGVTAGTADLFRITNNDAGDAADYFLAIVGTSV